MNPFHVGSCSCTGCVYRSRSREPNVQKIIQGGSEIDKLFYGKFLPLRERKLLEKLIRTRDVYDGVRNQLLCPCTSSDQTRRGYTKKRRNDLTTDSSSTVLEMVDMVDRGRHRHASRLNSCCSCCSCETLRKIRKRMQKEKPKPPCVYGHIVTCEDIAKYCAEAEERARKRRRKLSTQISSKIGSASKKMKKHLSEPCACAALSVSSVSTHVSKAFRDKIRSKKKAKETDRSRRSTIDQKTEIPKVSRLTIDQKTEIPKVSRLTTDQKTEIPKISRLTIDQKTEIPKVSRLTIDQKTEIPKVSRLKKDEKTDIPKVSKLTKDEKTDIPKVSRLKKDEKTDIPKVSKLTKDEKTDIPKVSRLTKDEKTDIPKASRLTNDQKTGISKVKRKSRKKEKKLQIPTTKDSGTELRSPLKSPIAFKIKKDSLILFKEKLLKKRPYDQNQDVECKPGTCDVSECLAEECFKHIQANSGKVKRKRKLHSRHSDTRRDRSYASESSRTKKVKLKRKLKQSVSKLNIKGKKAKPSQQSDKATKREKSSILTKLSASMTSIPKLKTKTQSAIKEEKTASKSKAKAKLQLVAKDKELEEKEKVLVQVSPKSDLGNVICECKPSTKSTSSITSSPKQEVSKSSPIPPALRDMSRHKSKRESQQKIDEADAQEPKRHVKAKRETRIKPIHGRIKQHKKHQHTKIQSETSQESFLRESGSQATEFYHGKVLPSPRNCEPLMCIPYECDPEKCAEILLSRSKSPSKSAKISTDRLRRKSVGSTAFSQRTSSRSRSKSKHNVSKSADSFNKKIKYVSKEPPPQIVEKNTGAESYQPDRQAVKISSSFSFNIEFYKDTFPGEGCECAYEKVDKKKSPILEDQQNQIKQKKHRRKYKNHGTRYTSSKERGTGDSTSRYNISSQSSSSQSSKNIQVGHKLKRCFCTLKLLQKKKQKVTHAASKMTMATIQNKELETGPRKKRTQTKLSGIAYVVPPATSRGSSLLPYECEPGFCTPGECNPYECAERIKQRHRRASKHVSRETNTAVTPRVSTFTEQSVSKSSRKIQSAENRKKKLKERHSQSPIQPALNKKIKQKERHSHSRNNIEPKLSSDKSQKQAVRIGSNLSINIEFSKTHINDDTDENIISDMPRKRERKHLHQMRQKGIKVKPRVRHDSSVTTTNEVKTKQTYTEPFLQRCLCTLKLLKKNKKKVEALSPWRNKNEYVMHMQNESVKTNRAEISYNHERTYIHPDEYGSGLCPYPYNYEKFVKLRQMRIRHKHLNEGDLTSRPTFRKALTSTKTRNQSVIDQSQQKIKTINQEYYETHLPSKHRLVQIGSNMSNNYINKRIHNKDNLNPQLNRPLDCKSIDTEADSKEKSSSVVSTIKRYFSHLTFKNKQNKVRLANKINEIDERTKTSYLVPNSRKGDYQSPRRRLSKYNYDQNSDVCVPKSCKPAMYDQNDCYDEYKWRKKERLHGHDVSTNKRERISTLNITRGDFGGSIHAKSTHSRLFKRKTSQEQNVRDKQKYMKAAVSFSPQAARHVSDLSFNKEFTKNRFVSFVQNNENGESNQRIKNRAEKYKILSEISAVRTITNKGTEDKYVASKDCILQADKFRKEAKTSNVGFLLKRCLCTLGLQKKGLPNSQFQWQQPITTQFVEVEHNKNKMNMHNLTKSGPNAPDKKMNRGKPFQSTLHEGGYVFRENCVRDQSGVKNPHHYGPQNLPNSNSYSRRVHIRPSLDLSFDKMKSLLNPFYKSFYALNVKISKSNIKRDPGDCISTDCDPDDCSTRLKRLKRLKKLAMTPTDCYPDDCSTKRKRLKRLKNLAMRPHTRHQQLVTQDTNCYEKCKAEFQNDKKTIKGKDDKKTVKDKDKPLIIGSDMSIRAGVYRDKDPYKNKRQLAVRVGSDVSVNFDFFKEPHNRSFFKTPKQTLVLPSKQDTKAARPTRGPEEIESKGSVISHLLQKCSCAAKLKKAYATKSEIYQHRVDEKPGKQPCRCLGRKSMPRVLRRKERPIKSKSVQYEDYTQKPHKHNRKKDRNNVTFCTDVDCLEYNKDDRQALGRGAGDEEKHHGKRKSFDKHDVRPSRREKRRKGNKKRRKGRKKKKLKGFIEKCYCHMKNKGKHLREKESLETIVPNKKRCEALDRAEREMETIMPYSKRKFKSIDSQPDLAEIESVKSTDSFTCQCRQSEKCPVCKAKAAGTYNRFKFMKKPCTCMNEPKKVTRAKDLSKCPMCKQNYRKGVSRCPCCKKPFAAGAGGIDQPLFQMTVNKANMRILNKDEVMKKMGSSAKAMRIAQNALDSTKYHESDCKCCICRAKRKAELKGLPLFTIDDRQLNPCICGSVVCKKDWEKIREEQRSRRAVKIKKCICGSNVCAEESEKMPEMLLEAAKQEEHDKEMSRRAQIKELEYQKARKKRLIEREIQKQKAAKAREKEDREIRKSIKKSAHAGSVTMIAESLIDLGTFGSKAFCDVAKYLYRGVLHPRDAISDVKEAIIDPGHAISSSLEHMGLRATLMRIKLRLNNMPVVAAIVKVMESNKFTNYLLHMADSNPKKRMREFKKKSMREPRDFECSLYMSSMRKRPCLRVYYLCPWFYPHCMSLLQVWKQCMDIFLFIFAVLVWSPCILCLELCRGCVCCLMCQG